MNRRNFINTAAAAVATVSIGLGMSRGMPGIAGINSPSHPAIVYRDGDTGLYEGPNGQFMVAVNNVGYTVDGQIVFDHDLEKWRPVL